MTRIPFEKQRARWLAREHKRTGYQEGVRFDYAYAPAKVYLIRCMFYPTVRWLAIPHTFGAPHKPTGEAVLVLDDALWQQLQPLRL